MKKLSVILLSYFSQKNIIPVYRDIVAVLEKKDIPFELIIMDDGSKDNSFEIARDLEKNDKRVSAYQLSRNYTSDYSIFAGFSVAKGDCAVVIPDDGQPSIAEIIDIYEEWLKGEKIVFLKRLERDDPPVSKFFAKTFYSIMDKISDVKFPPAGIETVLLDREVIDIINSRIHPINTAIIPEVLRLGYNPVYLSYHRPVSTVEKSRWTFKKKMRLAKNIFFSSSSFPIRFISFLGVFFSLISFMLIIFYLYINVFGNKTFWGYIPPGWTSTVLFISFFSGLILFALGIISEYIWRIYEEVKNRPGFIIRKKNSDEKN